MLQPSNSVSKVPRSTTAMELETGISGTRKSLSGNPLPYMYLNIARVDYMLQAFDHSKIVTSCFTRCRRKHKTSVTVQSMKLVQSTHQTLYYRASNRRRAVKPSALAERHCPSNGTAWKRDNVLTSYLSLDIYIYIAISYGFQVSFYFLDTCAHSPAQR